MATKARKEEIVSELNTFFKDGKVCIVTDVSGLTVAELTQLRRKLDKDKARCRVAKNTLVKIATASKDFEAIKSLAKGPSAIIIGYDDPAAPAKTTVDFFKALKKGVVRGGVLEGRALTQEEIKGLAELPSKEQLLSSIMGGLDSGARNIAGILESIIRDIALLAEEVAKKNDAA
jgi:large subunit ribosomal protein L10